MKCEGRTLLKWVSKPSILTLIVIIMLLMPILKHTRNHVGHWVCLLWTVTEHRLYRKFSLRKRIKSEVENFHWSGKYKLIRRSVCIQSRPLMQPLVAEDGSFHFHHEPSMTCAWAGRESWMRKLPNTPEENDSALSEIRPATNISFYWLTKAGELVVKGNSETSSWVWQKRRFKNMLLFYKGLDRLKRWAIHFQQQASS